jgi:hypothetical protein
MFGAGGLITVISLPLHTGNSSTVCKSAGGSVGKVKVPYIVFEAY